jgi:hypothetical protein
VAGFYALITDVTQHKEAEKLSLVLLGEQSSGQEHSRGGAGDWYSSGAGRLAGAHR